MPALTAADRAAYAERQRVLAEHGRILRDIEAKRNRAAFGPAPGSDAWYQGLLEDTGIDDQFRQAEAEAADGERFVAEQREAAATPIDDALLDWVKKD